MAEIDFKLQMDVKVTLELNSREAAALGALAGYGTDEFLKIFYKHMGQAYLKPYEQGLRSLFRAVRGADTAVSGQLGDVRKAIAEFHGKQRPAP